MSDKFSVQPEFPEHFKKYPETPQIGHSVRIYDDDNWFDEGIVSGISGGYVHVQFKGWIQSWKASDLEYTLEDFVLCIVPKACVTQPLAVCQ